VEWKLVAYGVWLAVSVGLTLAAPPPRADRGAHSALVFVGDAVIGACFLDP
jgi:hypothetical protein